MSLNNGYDHSTSREAFAMNYSIDMQLGDFFSDIMLLPKENRIKLLRHISNTLISYSGEYPISDLSRDKIVDVTFSDEDSA